MVCSLEHPTHAACWLVTLVSCALSVHDPIPRPFLHLSPIGAHSACGYPRSVEAGREGSFQGSMDKPFTSKWVA